MTGKPCIYNKEDGAVQIIEATVVFPIMFIVLFFLIFMGNAFYEKAQVESLIQENAIIGAAYCADPFLETMQSGSVPTSIKNAPETEPYRYIIGGMDSVEVKIRNRIKNEINKHANSFFRDMYPKLKGAPKVQYRSHVIYPTFSVEAKYVIPFPIRFFGKATPPVLEFTVRAEAPVNETAEFIRNTDMAVDLFSQTKFAGKIDSYFQKAKNVLDSFSKK